MIMWRATLVVPGALLVAAAGFRPPGGSERPAPAAAPSPGQATHLAAGRWLRIIATNDFHGALEPRRDGGGTNRGGAAALAAEIARARAECVAPSCVSLLLDGGDEFQGTPVSNLSYGRPVVEIFNRLGRVASALGNHDLDWGQDTLRARMRDARYAILGANVVDDAGTDVPWIPDDTLVTLGDLRVGIIGIATVGTPRMSKPENVRGLRFVPPAPVVDARARALRARGAQRIIVVAHAGAFCNRDTACDGEIVELALGVTEPIDAIVSGHTHSPVSTVIRGVPVVQARANGTALGVVDLPLDDGKVPVVALRDVLPDRVAADPAIDELVKERMAPLRALVERPIAEIAEPMPQEVVGNLIADAQRAAATGDVAVMNAGGVRAAIAAGTATYGSLFEVAPFGNTLVVITLKGSALRTYLQKLADPRARAHLSGATVTYDPARPAGDRILSVIMSDGRALDDRRTYRLVMSDFMASGGDGLQVGEGAIAVEETGLVDLDALIAWVRGLPSPVRAPRDQRLVPRPPGPAR